MLLIEVFIMVKKKKKFIERWFVVYIVGYIVNLGREMSDVM